MDSTAANITDDQELAKVLETMNQQATNGVPPIPTSDTTQADAPVADQAADGMAFEQTPEVAPVAPEEPASLQTIDTPPAPMEAPVVPEPAFAAPAFSAPAVASAAPELDAIKKDALEELRPLVDKLNLPADEKFDTLLLIIRSTDDKSLVTAAHEAARAIEDETKRAQALLDVIKEIDYFSGNGQQPA